MSIKEMRNAANMTQQAFADYFGISKRSIENWEGDQRKCPAYLLDLMEYDRIQGTQYYNTLRVYLLCERNIPATAAALIIHRTTLTYRLGKILELTHLNLDNANLRMYLLLSFQLLDQDGNRDFIRN